MAKFIYGFLHNETPDSFCGYFCKTNERSSQATRQSSDCNNLNILRYRPTNKLQRCIKYQGVRIWNCIPTNIRAFSHKKFKYSNKNFYYLRTNTVLASKIFLTQFAYSFMIKLSKCLLWSHKKFMLMTGRHF